MKDKICPFQGCGKPAKPLPADQVWIPEDVWPGVWAYVCDTHPGAGGHISFQRIDG